LNSRRKDVGVLVADCHTHLLNIELVGLDDALPAAVMRYLEQAIAAGREQQELSAVFEVLLPKVR
jgi:hypothetical protein